MEEVDPQALLDMWDVWASGAIDLEAFIRRIWYEKPRDLLLATQVLEMCERAARSKKIKSQRELSALTSAVRYCKQKFEQEALLDQQELESYRLGDVCSPLRTKG